jgi:DNA-binding NtrC family response regulator
VVDTTIPRDATADADHQAPSWAVVLGWSADEPHRVGEVAFLRVSKPLFVGRGGDDPEKFACFFQQRPGEPLPRPSREGFLAGRGISHEQLRVEATPTGVVMESVGRAVTWVNGVEKKRAVLQHNDAVLVQGAALLICVLRPQTLPGPRARRAFGAPDDDKIVGEGPEAYALREAVAKVAATDHDVLIRGESGTGKELVATAIHRRSKRANGPFVERNAATFTVSLADSELFGNAANYPNHGMPARPGLVGAAHQGTAFLDEIGDLPLEVQAKLLRVLDAGRYQLLGEATTRTVDIRFIGATNKDDSAYRPDFRARFRASVRIPPLRERREDIPLLIRHALLREAHKDPDFAKRFCRVGKTGTLEPKVSGRLVDYLVRQPLPRNVREVEELLVTAVMETREGDDDLKLPRSISTASTTPPPEPPEEEEMQDRRRDPTEAEVRAAHAREGGNVSRMGKSLRVGRNVVYRLMQKYGLKKDETDA